MAALFPPADAPPYWASWPGQDDRQLNSEKFGIALEKVVVSFRLKYEAVPSAWKLNACQREQ
jgi:hypothetical protein